MADHAVDIGGKFNCSLEQPTAGGHAQHVRVGGAGKQQGIRAGKMYILRHQIYAYDGFTFKNVKGITLRGVQIWAGAGMGYLFRSGSSVRRNTFFAPLSHNTTANNQEANFPSKHFVFFPAGHSHPAVRCASTAWPADVDQRRRHALCRGERLFLQPLIFFLFLPRACLGKFWWVFHRERFPEFIPE
jgi:hypothetical protein